ncbi:maleylpyruvate isomerase family mycothiol-dependent enzyme [Nakamurella endophytica]|uniref:Maleylpyruvate isomerase family mycothiol-dependent enzyme n=1 Tax=Nakamurella endophytica TaxID=1748367 RepID=A0A917WJJ7_9ACTN|nr:maleylpyruvate isomerase family mycothiol-dependent enzyme [Nakamurella endophytica]GGM08678.1 hypothetical protein GCM10011594_30730 [Nakamurella endophytica]
MPTDRAGTDGLLPVERYLEVLALAADELLAHAGAAGHDARVPTCPEWTVADLVAHQGVVHRWAAGHLELGDRADGAALERDAEASRPAGRAELEDWFRSGARQLAAAVERAPDDLSALRFLAEPPPARLFWARRQAHETSVHRVDALAARLGRAPVAAEVGVPASVAADGIDELLCGFLPRPRSRVRTADPLTVAVLPDDVDAAWTVRLSDATPATVRGVDESEPADATVRGTAAELYLWLWNRGDGVRVSGAAGLQDLWRAGMQVSWT